jgi:hypothetical protein
MIPIQSIVLPCSLHRSETFTSGIIGRFCHDPESGSEFCYYQNLSDHFPTPESFLLDVRSIDNIFSRWFKLISEQMEIAGRRGGSSTIGEFGFEPAFK